ncbi:filamentous hemagglutinin N-terminal domain-containing protein [Bradyrhizobium sp. 190]|uniref:MBG domain-containing protein n=1 Tax=Bradyrhizobium sp. 190 TaxID=2782658 RepID=UPI001FF72D7D|nr:MBG domain-containing protein [Bradyrhizobium sp. 190]MCK1516521.1 filamentous hemagglutinin N-terminal domain-containing protein [Bradyrhizobium sp. 190]
MAQSLPTGGTVASGNVSISSTSPTSLTVTQSSRTGIVNWSSFSIGQGNQVQFNNGSGATLNRVTGNVPSSINGVLSATGSVYLVNPSGIVVGPSGIVKTGGSFVASTLDVRDTDFRAGGALTFSGNSNASVVNLGKIGSSKGDVVLIARQLRNDGSLTARNGTAAMASGSEVVLSDGSLGNGKVLVRRPAQDGEIRNSGAIRAAEVELRANGGNIYALAGNTGRTITATGVASKGGRIFLTAEGGSVNVTQKVVARRVQANVARAGIASQRGPFTGGDVIVSGDKVVVGGTIEAKGSGGTVVVTGTDVILTSGATIDASGTSGGTVLIGGDRLGGSDATLKFLPQTIANAQTTTIEAGATITADGTSGAGGNVVVWSDGTTSFAGAISTQGLRGGFIETSGHVFNFAGGSINAGRGGAWLLDPVDLTIDATLAGTIATALNGGSNVTQLTSASGSGGTGDITVASGISWSTNATLTLSAYRNIAVNANIASTGGGGVVLAADNAGTGTGTVTFGGGQISTAGMVSIFYNPTGSSSTVNTTKYTAPTQTSFSGNVTGGATLKTHMLVNNVFDLQNMKNSLTGTYALGRDIDASITSGWNSGAGFESIGAGVSFNGNLDGLGHTISGLFINRITQNVGLIAYLGTSASVSNLGVIGATVTGRTAVGAVVGSNYGTVTNVYSSGSITATEAGAGGLVGYNFNTVSNGYSSSTVRGPLYVGGAVGLNNCSSSGCASGPGLLSQIYATGAVIGTGTGPTSIGGLVGLNASSVTASYWDSYTSGQTLGVGSGGSGGVTAVTSDPALSAAANYAFKQSAYGSFSFPGASTAGWFMIDGQTRPFGRWEYQTTITNAHQLQLMAMNLGASYTLAGNIDLSSSLAAVSGKYPGMWSPAGFVPIGSTATQFTGAFNGQGRTIANLTINRPSAANVGLFGYIGSSATISDIGLVGVNVSGSINTGTLVGYNEAGTITRAYATGAVTASSDVVGGLVASNTGSIMQSYAAVTVTESGAGHSAGGLVGSNSGLIQQSYATGAVSSGGTRVGGLVGGNSGNVQLSYATGAVSGTSDVGGLVGYHTNFGSIAQAYAAGAVSGASAVGGLVGTSNNSATIAQSYWDTVTSGRAIGVGSGPTTGAIGLTTSQMQDPANFASTYAGWDFANVWSAPSAGYYPQLYGVNYVLRIDPANASRAYGDANPALTYTSYGLHTGDTSAILAGLSLSTAATMTSNVGSYAITAGGSVTSIGGQAYRLIQAPAALTVTPRSITVTADAKSRAYGDANPALTWQVGGSGLVNGDTLSGALATSATTASNVGTYGIGQGTLTASGNYALNYTSANLTVTPRSITVTADAKNRAYGDANPALTYQVGGAGLVNGDTLSGALATSATTASNVGVYGITQGTLASSNYAISSFTGANLTVTQRAITVTADAKSRAYGDTNPALTYQVSGAGLVNGDSLSGALVTSATTASNVGTYGIGQGTLTVSGNYALNYTSNNLTVTQRAITVTADAKSRAYGDVNPALTYQVGGSGLVNGDMLSGALATSATTSSNVGSYGITQGSLAASGNYALNYTSNNLTVTQRAITVTADAKSRAYGDVNPTLTYQVGGSGLVNGDTLSGALATSATTASNVGTYGIGQGTLAASGNYALNYTSNNLTVTQRAITVTADAKSRAYGDVNPALTYQVGGSGLVNGDTLSGALATSATAASNVGIYGITQGSLAASTNYALNYASANLTVTQRAITVTADAKSRAYGEANPALTYQVGGSGLVNGDTLSGALATSATTSSDAGVYGITQGTLAASSNYAFAFVGANLTVTPAATPRVPAAELAAYVKSRVALPAPQPPAQMREPVSIEQPSAAIICKSRQCLELPHPRNRRIGERARFVDTMISRDRLPAFADN